MTKEQQKLYSSIKIFIIGQKQKKYTVEKELREQINFNIEKDIIDIIYLSKEIVTLDIDKLESLFTLFQKSFRELIIELEPMDVEGNFESSIYHYVEQIPNSPPKNIGAINKLYEQDDEPDEYVVVYNELASVPKSQREYICLIADRGTLNTSGLQNYYEIHCTKLAGILRINEEELFKNMSYLEDEGLVRFENDKDEYDRPNFKYSIRGEYLTYLILFLKEANISLRRTLVALDFTILESDDNVA